VTPPRSPSLADLTRALGLPAAPSPSLVLALVTARLLTEARWGAWVRVGTLDGHTQQVVCVDPAAPDCALPGYPVCQGPTQEAAVADLVEPLHRLNLRDAGVVDEDDAELAAIERAIAEAHAAEVAAHTAEPDPTSPGDPRFDAPPGLARCEPAGDVRRAEVA